MAPSQDWNPRPVNRKSDALSIAYRNHVYRSSDSVAVFDARCQKCVGDDVVSVPQQRVASSAGEHHEGVLSAAGTAATDVVC